ncbi:TonB-dependent siderophore receptor [Pseudoxanthomonas indica]|uniref:Iron complex outermembrane recepter protein n=1 Tax=Pseudoxanthomonas indica TaxID=428993 RepID=A0A1T5J3N4_9GAMM|nr:TonB-dependent siderophore receptor [Pseudoxanthomonas indica]SKC45808.1 iron complex outermembrane recepter protein [Pseudoxanthomonas indica]
MSALLLRARLPRHSLLYVGLLGACLTAQAQDASTPADESAPRSDATELDAVQVKGERLGLNLNLDASSGALGTKRLLDTPFSVTVVEQEDIEKRGATTLGQVFINDPSVYAAEPSATTAWWGTQIRGIGVTNHYVDGVPMLMEWGGEYPLEAVESVQALKGLGGFMYGFGSPGGIISYRTKRPTADALLSTTLGWRNDSAFSMQVDASDRIDGPDSLGLRVNAVKEGGDAYNGAGIDRTLIALAVEQPIGDNLLWHAEVLREDNTLKHEPIYFYWDSYEGDRLPTPSYDYDNVRVRNSYYKAVTTNATTGLEWRISENWNVDFTVGASQREHYSNKMFGNLLNEGGDYTGSVYNFAGDLRNSVAQALVTGHVETGGIRHDLVFGVSALRTWERWGNDWYWSEDFSGNLYQRQDFLSFHVPDFSWAPFSYDERQQAVFASDTIHFGEQWQAILGARYMDYEQRDRDGNPDVDSRYATSALTPTVAVIYKPVDQVSIYASYVESLESAGRVGFDSEPPYANAGDVLDATISKQYEIGAKYQTGRFGFTTAAFRVERAAQIDQWRGEERWLAQDGLTLYRGFEAIASYGVTDTLDVGLGGLWMDPSLEELSPENAALQGNRPAGSSRRQYVANFEYRPAALRGFSLHGNVRYSGDQYYEDANRVLIPGRTVADLGFQYRTTIGGRTATLTGNVNNLFNRKYWNLDMLGEARNGSLDLRIDW